MPTLPPNTVYAKNIEKLVEKAKEDIMKEVNQIMSTYVGIVRSDLRLKRAWDRLDIIYEETESLFKRSVASREICELRNMVNVGYLIMRQAMERKESRGLHYTIDYPHVKK